MPKFTHVLWNEDKMKFLMGRRKVLKLSGEGIKAIGYMLFAGYVGETPGNVIDSIRSRWNAPEPKTHRVDAESIFVIGSLGAATVHKRGPDAVRDYAT